jgi:hypothetical protein
MNFVRKHALEQAAEMGMSVREAATRIFSNSSGSYSSNVNLAVENSSWQDEAQLQEMYLKRKSFAFNSDRPGAGGEEARDIFERSMKTVEVTFQNLDSSEISLTDVSHYFDSGGWRAPRVVLFSVGGRRGACGGAARALRAAAEGPERKKQPTVSASAPDSRRCRRPRRPHQAGGLPAHGRQDAQRVHRRHHHRQRAGAPRPRPCPP